MIVNILLCKTEEHYAYCTVYFMYIDHNLLKLLGPMLCQILYTLLTDGYAKYVYNERHCISLPVN